MACMDKPPPKPAPSTWRGGGHTRFPGSHPMWGPLTPQGPEDPSSGLRDSSLKFKSSSASELCNLPWTEEPGAAVGPGPTGHSPLAPCAGSGTPANTHATAQRQAEAQLLSENTKPQTQAALAASAEGFGGGEDPINL